MSGLRLRLSTGFALLALLALLAERSGAHGHAMQEIDLVPHSLMLVEGGPGCGPASHLETADRHEHPVCGSCTLASSPTTAARTPVLVAHPGPAARYPIGLADRPATAAAHGRPARAPPLA